MSLFEILIVLLIMSTILAVYTRIRGFKGYRITKPLPALILFLMMVSVLHGGKTTGYFPYAIGTGLACGFLGDIFLLMEKRLFVVGLISFFIGHVFYLSAFLSKTTNVNFIAFLLIIPAIVFYVIVSRRLNQFGSRQHNAMSLYAVTILSMCLAAFSFELSIGSSIPVFGIGAVLFLISDSVLSWSVFVKDSIVLHGIVLVTYYAAQIIIAGMTIYLLGSGVI